MDTPSDTPETDKLLADSWRPDSTGWHNRPVDFIETLESHARQMERSRGEVIRVLDDLSRLAEVAMKETGNDGGEYDIEGELSEARALIKRYSKP